MSKKITFEENIISKIKNEEIKMKPRWYFVLSSIMMFVSLVGLSMALIFLTNLVLFVVRRNGFFNIYKFQVILSSFPWWIPLVAVLGLITAVWLLKKYDFSYKNNFILIIVLFLSALFLSGVLLDEFGLNEYLSRGKMRGYYQRLELQEGSTENILHRPGYGRQFK